MYYNGSVLSLWGYLAELLYRSHQNDVFSSLTISQSPHLAFLLLRFIECSTFVRDSTTSATGRNIRVPAMLENLGNIIEAPNISPELKARAMAIRLLEQYIWREKGVMDLWGKPLDEQAKQRTLDESKKAIEIMEGVSGHSCVLAYLARIRVEYGTVNITVPTWDKLMAQEHLFDRDDLYGSCWFFAFMTKHAIDFKDQKALPKIIPAIHKAKSLKLGEWDKIFHRQLAKLESSKFYQECEATLRTAQSPKVTNVSKNVRHEPTIESVVTREVSRAVADEIVNSFVQSL